MRYTFLLPGEAVPVRLALRPGSMAVSVGDDVGWSFDGEGRLYAGHRSDAYYRRGLSHRVRERRGGAPGTAARDLLPDERVELFGAIRMTMDRLLSLLPDDCPDEFRAAVESAAGWSATRYEEDARRFGEVYSPVGILPPDLYLSVLLQATTGCHYNACTFCDFYRRVPYAVKSPSEFADHVKSVKALVGRGLPMRKKIFLGDASALAVSGRRLMSVLDSVHAEFDVAPAELKGGALARWLQSAPSRVSGIYSFMDAFDDGDGRALDMADLSGRGLRRIYVGAETGHLPLLRFLRKPGEPDAVRNLVRRAFVAGIRVGVIIMTGIGGRLYADGHLADTALLVNSLDLGAGDVVYISRFVEPRDSDYSEDARSAGIVPLTDAEIDRQGELLRTQLRLAPAVKVASYSVSEFIY